MPSLAAMSLIVAIAFEIPFKKIINLTKKTMLIIPSENKKNKKITKLGKNGNTEKRGRMPDLCCFEKKINENAFLNVSKLIKQKDSKISTMCTNMMEMSYNNVKGAQKCT